MCEISTEKTSKAYRMHYKPEINRLVAHFQGATGLHSFDLRKASDPKLYDYYNLHYYQITDYDVGNETL